MQLLLLYEILSHLKGAISSRTSGPFIQNSQHALFLQILDSLGAGVPTIPSKTARPDPVAHKKTKNKKDKNKKKTEKNNRADQSRMHHPPTQPPQECKKTNLVCLLADSFSGRSVVRPNSFSNAGIPVGLKEVGKVGLDVRHGAGTLVDQERVHLGGAVDRREGGGVVIRVGGVEDVVAIVHEIVRPEDC